MKILILANYKLPDSFWASIADCSNHCGALHTFSSQPSGESDLVCVLNWPQKVAALKVRKGGALKIVQEPTVPRSPYHLFVDNHSRFLDVLVGHDGARPKSGFRGKFIERPPFLPHHVPILFGSGAKTELFSIIASNLKALPGHKARSLAVDSLVGASPSLESHLFGKGRKYVESKVDALDPYMFSLAIENSSIPSYVTEKVTDCFRRNVVPVYYGAINLGEFFPEASFIRLNSLDPDEILLVVGGLSPAVYEERLPAVLESKRRTGEDRLCCFLIKTAAALPDQYVLKFFGLDWPSLLARSIACTSRVIQHFRQIKSSIRLG